MTGLTFTVFGTPAPQGSKNAYRNRHTGRVALVESSARVKPWREDVRQAALAALGATPTDRSESFPLAGPVAVRIAFTLPRPKHHYRTGRNARHLLRDGAPVVPASRPDLDKLTRATLDAIDAAGVLGDDGQVVDLHVIKAYPCGLCPGGLLTPGAVIQVEPWARPCGQVTA